MELFCDLATLATSSTQEKLAKSGYTGWRGKVVIFILF
jgi:hypothetical protein